MLKNRLLEIRLKLGYKYAKEFSEFLGIKGSTYSLIENNKKNVNLDNAFEIAERLANRIEEQ